MDTTNQTGRIIVLWNGSWIAALAVGVLVWGLILWCAVAYRRRRDDTGLPAQVRYNIPLEILYTVVPLIMIAVLFFYTASDESAIADVSAKPDVTINVVGKQWAWDFNYLQQGGQQLNVYEAGVKGELNGQPGVEQQLPTLYLPVDRRVRVRAHLAGRQPLVLDSRLPLQDGPHRRACGTSSRSCPDTIGDVRGKCAELCGEYHSEMLFNVKVVSQADFDAHMSSLRAQGNVGVLDSNLGRTYTPPGPGAVPGGTTNGVDGTGSK